LQDADVTDILNACKKIDESSYLMPTFVPLKLDRLPRYDPEEINVFSLIDRLAVVEKELAIVKNDVGHVKSQSVAPSSENHPFPNLYSNVVALPPLPAKCPNQPKVNSQSANVDVNALPPQDQAQKSTHNKVQSHNGRPDNNTIGRTVNNQDTVFTEVKSRKNRRNARPAVTGNM